MSIHLVSSLLLYMNRVSGPMWLTHLTEKRKAEAERIRQKYPDRIPVSSWWNNGCWVPNHSVV